MDKTYSVMVVEDDIYCRDRFIKAIQQRHELKVFDEANCLSAALLAVEEQFPDILVTDIGLPDGSGIDLIRHCRDKSPDTLCLVVTIYGDESHVLDAMKAGAKGYLQKDSPLSELGEAIVSIIKGGIPISPSIANALLKYLDTDRPVNKEETETILTPRETEVLKMISKGYSRDEISESLNISLNTVSAHTKNIYMKMEVHSGTSAIHMAKSKGWI